MRRADPFELDDRYPAEAPSLESCDESAQDAPRHGACPAGLLAEFTTRMARHGRSIDPDLMRGDREYAMWQLARARTTGDESLRSLAAQLFTCLEGRAR